MDHECCQKISNAEIKFPESPHHEGEHHPANNFGAEAEHIIAHPEEPRWDGHSSGSPGMSQGD